MRDRLAQATALLPRAVRRQRCTKDAEALAAVETGWPPLEAVWTQERTLWTKWRGEQWYGAGPREVEVAPAVGYPTGQPPRAQGLQASTCYVIATPIREGAGGQPGASFHHNAIVSTRW